MPELMPTYERLAALAGGSDLAARFLSSYCPPSYLIACSQAVWSRDAPLLVRNYDYDPALLEPVIWSSALTGRRVIGMSDCLWGLLDGVNDAGLAVSLTFGGRRDVGEGIAIPLVVRYLLETCDTVAQARAALDHAVEVAEATGREARSDAARVTAATETYRAQAKLDDVLTTAFRQLTALMEERGLR
jgi:predicted choloylglycine hydrolase